MPNLPFNPHLTIVQQPFGGEGQGRIHLAQSISRFGSTFGILNPAPNSSGHR